MLGVTITLFALVMGRVLKALAAVMIGPKTRPACRLASRAGVNSLDQESNGGAMGTCAGSGVRARAAVLWLRSP